MDVIDDRPDLEINEEYRPWDMDVNSFCMLMHLSQFAGAIVPMAGFAMPIIMWATQKDKSEMVDIQGKNILNFMFSYILYAVISVILALVLVGIFLLIAIGIASLVFIIIGAIRANEGKVYDYPFTIKFIR